MNVVKQIQAIKSELERRRDPDIKGSTRSRRIIELETRLRLLVTQQLRREIRADRKSA
jgi:hypothetical protein